jgi:hypothetical protein
LQLLQHFIGDPRETWKLKEDGVDSPKRVTVKDGKLQIQGSIRNSATARFFGSDVIIPTVIDIELANADFVEPVPVRVKQEPLRLSRYCHMCHEASDPEATVCK